MKLALSLVVALAGVLLLGNLALIGAIYLKQNSSPIAQTSTAVHPAAPPPAQTKATAESTLAGDVHRMRMLAEQKANDETQKTAAVEQARTTWDETQSQDAKSQTSRSLAPDGKRNAAAVEELRCGPIRAK